MTSLNVIGNYLPALAAFEEGLRRTGCFNFTVSTGLFKAQNGADFPIEEMARLAIGADVEVGHRRNCTTTSIVDEVTACLLYRGDYAAHPDLDFLASPQAQVRLDLAIRELEALLGSAEKCTAITLLKGHPFNPVFWGYTFVFTQGRDAFVLIGCSSD
ncbi:MAG: hypothetical protein ACI84E_002294 [Planctomycetota bacterium]|jgi:hypothetical protein